jgi:hypothetical protein
MSSQNYENQIGRQSNQHGGTAKGKDTVPCLISQQQKTKMARTCEENANKLYPHNRFFIRNSQRVEDQKVDQK